MKVKEKNDSELTILIIHVTNLLLTLPVLTLGYTQMQVSSIMVISGTESH